MKSKIKYDKFNEKFNKSFCIKPFTEYCNSTCNDLQLCCVSDTLIQMPSDVDVVDTFYNHEFLTEVRNKMLNNEYVSACQSCYDREKYQHMSPRLSYTNIMYEHYPEIVEDAFNGTAKLVSFDLKFGNVCNQGCVMCSPWVSSFIAKEQDEEVINFNNNNLNTLKDHANNIIRFKTTGGEPMLQPGFKKSIDILIEHGNPKNIHFCNCN